MWYVTIFITVAVIFIITIFVHRHQHHDLLRGKLGWQATRTWTVLTLSLVSWNFLLFADLVKTWFYSLTCWLGTWFYLLTWWVKTWVFLLTWWVKTDSLNGELKLPLFADLVTWFYLLTWWVKTWVYLVTRFGQAFTWWLKKETNTTNKEAKKRKSTQMPGV